MYALNVHAAPGCAYGNECMMLMRVRRLEGMEGGGRGGRRLMTCRAYLADRSEVRGAKGWKHTIMRSRTRMEIGASRG